MAETAACDRLVPVLASERQSISRQAAEEPEFRDPSRRRRRRDARSFMGTQCHVTSIIALEGRHLRSADFLNHPAQRGEKSAHDRLILQRGKRNGWAPGDRVDGEMNAGNGIEVVQQLHALGLSGKWSSRLHHLKLDLHAAIGPDRDQLMRGPTVIEHREKRAILATFAPPEAEPLGGRPGQNGASGLGFLHTSSGRQLWKKEEASHCRPSGVPWLIFDSLRGICRSAPCTGAGAVAAEANV